MPLLRSLSLGLIAACTAPLDLDGPSPSDGPTQVADDTASQADPGPSSDTDDGVEQVPADEWSPGDVIFAPGVIHDVALEIGDASWQSLSWDPRTYAPAGFALNGAEHLVEIRLKGNTTYRAIDDKPALIVDFNRAVPEQTVDGLSSVYLHNMTYDPALMHEHLAYEFFRNVGAPASRTGYARLTVNGEHYGLYLFVEKQNRVYRERWWDDAGGSMYETGSFNHGCDLDDTSPAENPCNCFEIEEEVDGGREALRELCWAAVTPDAGWMGEIEQHVDMDAFVRSMAAEIVISHYDNYGWNANNWRIYHEPTQDRWHWTPWSTDLSFGWYPWSGDPRCGSYGQHPSEYVGGYLMARCASVPACKEALRAQIELGIQTLEVMDMPARIDETYALIRAEAFDDDRKWYGNDWFESGVACAREWVGQRPGQLRVYLEDW